MTAAELYAAMCQFAADHGYRREEPGSGWWWQEEGDPSGTMTLGELVEYEFDRQKIDTRKPPAVVIQVDDPGSAGGEGTP